MPAKRPTPKPRIALRSGFGEIGAVGTVASTSTRKLPVTVALRICRSRSRCWRMR